MSGTLPPSISRPRLTPAAAAQEPLAQSYDPPVRGAVLLATDARGASDAVFRAAKAVAERLGTNVEVVGVLEPFPSYLMAPETPVLPRDVEDARRTAIRAAITRRLEAVGVGAQRWPISIAYGEPARTIARVGGERDSTLIVVGSGRHAPRDRIFGGERAIRAVRAADRPVLAVPPTFEALPTAAVAGVDFSPASVRAARTALLLLPEGGRLVLVHVRPPVDVPPAPLPSALAADNFDDLLTRWREDAEAEEERLFQRLRDELRPYTPAGVTIETVSRIGPVLTHLLGVADDERAGLIAVGTRGPGVVERFFIGSVATDALREAGRAVLVAPAPSPAECARIELRMRGTAEVTRADDWGPALEAFSKRNAGRRVHLEVDDPDMGAQVQESGFALIGVTYDRRDRCVELMLGDPRDRTRHLTRTIPHADDVAFYAAPDGREKALRVERGHAQTLLSFLD